MGLVGIFKNRRGSAATRVICCLGDVKRPVKERAMHGPSQLRFRNKLFEPLDGFEALLG